MRFTVIATPLAVGLVGAVLAGCGSQGGAQASCPPIPTGEAPPTSPLVAVLPSSGGGPAGSESMRVVVDGATELGARTLLGRPGGETAVDAYMVAQGPNNLMRNTDIVCKTTAVRSAYARLARNAPATAPDLISALGGLHAQLETGEASSVHVVVLGTGVSRTRLGGDRTVDLGRFRDLRRPAVTINRLATAGLNFSCAGWNVTFAGSGIDPRGRRLGGAHASALEEFWIRYFRHCGGAVVGYTPTLIVFPPEGGPVAGADRRLLPVRVARRAGRVVATLDGSVFFDSGSAGLRPGTTMALHPVARLVEGAGGRVRVEGHTDDRGVDAVNDPLSLARATAVSEWILRTTEVPRGRIAVRGFGARRPVADNSTPEGRARNRRVVITIEGA